MNAIAERLTHRPLRIHVLGGLLTLTTLAALFAGVQLVLDPTGASLGLPQSLLRGTPFPDFTIPGRILLALFGVVPIPILVGLWLEKAWARFGAALLGYGIAVWMVLEVVLSGAIVRSPLQPIFWAAGLTLLWLGAAPAWRPAR